MVAFRAISILSDPKCQTVSVEEAAARLGISRGTAYEMRRAGIFPVPVITIGVKQKQYRIPVGALNELLVADGPNP